MIFNKLFFEWSILILILGLGIYTMKIIKNEKNKFLIEAREVIFKNFKLRVPTWWGSVETNTENELCFKRLDTRYEWEAKLIWNDTPSEKEIVELFKEHITERKILFDEESSVIYNPNYFKDGPIAKNGNFEIVRLEGTATKDRSDRLYYDAFLIKNKTTHQYLYAESKSSVLNGLVEGPYFEEVMLRIEVI